MCGLMDLEDEWEVQMIMCTDCPKEHTLLLEEPSWYQMVRTANAYAHVPPPWLYYMATATA